MVCTIKYRTAPVESKSEISCRRYSEGMAALAQSSSQEHVITETIRSVPAPDGVRLRRFFFDRDHTGDPAIRVIFGVSKKYDLTKQRLSELNQFRVNVGRALWNASEDRIPYVTFEDAK